MQLLQTSPFPIDNDSHLDYCPHGFVTRELPLPLTDGVRVAFTEIVRWSGSFAVALTAHAAVFAYARDQIPHAPTPRMDAPVAVILELAPLPVSPPATIADASPSPDLNDVIPEPDPPPPIESLPQMAVGIPMPESSPITPPKPPERQRPVEKKAAKTRPERRTAPPVSSQDAATSSAPMTGAAPETQSAELPTWKGRLLRHLERHKQYPSDAQRSRHEGITYIHFTMTRDGRVLAARVERTAGIASLDREGLDLLQRAQPLPPLPADQPGETLALVVPVQFRMRR
jgi:protein TonB